MSIEEIRKRTGLTQKEFAKVLGCSQSAVSFWEMGARKPSAAMALKIVKLVGLGKEAAFDLLEGDNDIRGESGDS